MESCDPNALAFDLEFDSRNGASKTIIKNEFETAA